MAVTNKRIIAGSQLTTSAATYYTAPSSTKCIIKRLTFTNTTAGAVTVTVYLIPFAGSASDSNTISHTHSVAANETWICSEAEGQVIEQLGFIQALASAGTSITIMASGVEIV